MRFGVRGKLSLRYVGPFEIMDKVGEVAYRLALPPALSAVHDVFHVSMLKKCLFNPSSVIELEPLELAADLSYEEVPECIVARKEQILCSRSIPYVKVKWQHHSTEEATWEREEDMRERYPFLF
ncbi:uncharacterized protein LOC143856036 [Tasmannia lanceolata]|uniref:uncharacterized protein LOC143856036 n=1 Tax=Tasmannia lanceolata TaxID=3420 RepID=UPI004064AF54